MKFNLKTKVKRNDDFPNSDIQNYRSFVALILERNDASLIPWLPMNSDRNVHFSLMVVINVRYIVGLFDRKGRSTRNRTCSRTCVFTVVCQRTDVCETNRYARSFSKQRWWNDLPRANTISIPSLMSPVSTFPPRSRRPP